MTDVIGDLDAIIGAVRRDTTLLFFTDGLTWKARTVDLRKDRQNLHDRYARAVPRRPPNAESEFSV